MRAASSSPAPAHIGDALELADLLRPSWPALRDEVHRTAAFTNEGEEEVEEPGENQPSPDDEHSPDGNQQVDEGDEVPDFLGTYDLGDVPEEAKPVAEAAVKRLTAAYTKQRQEDTQAVREAQDAQRIVDALADPQRAPAILQALGVSTGFEEEEDDEFAFEDPNDRIDALHAEIRQRDEIAQAESRVREENAYVTQQIESLEDKLQTEFTEEEISLLYMLADENRDAQGNPDVKAAHTMLDALAATANQRLIKAKSRAPRAMGKGTVGDRQVDLNDPKARRKLMEAAADAARVSSE
jgi:hypothetical protein